MEFYNEGGIATFKKGDWAKRKKKNQQKEAKRRYDEGDRSSYVMKKYGNTQKETANLTKAQKQKNYQRTGSETGFDPYKRRDTFKQVTKGDDRSKAILNQQWERQEAINQFLDDRDERREHMARRFIEGDPTLDKKEFQKKIKGYTDGLFGLNIGAKYPDKVWDPVKRRKVKDKLRLGLGSNDYFDYMQRLQNLNPKKMDTINPWGSGTTVRKMITKGLGAPKYGLDQLGQGYNWLKENTGDFGQMINDFGSIPGNALKKMGVITPTDDKLMDINNRLTGEVEGEVQKVINPEAATNFEDVPPDWLTTRPDDNIESELAEAIMSGRDFANPGGSMLPSDTINTRIGVLTGNQQSDRERKIQFIREATGGSYDIIPADDYTDEHVDTLYEIMKQKVGKGISEDIAEDRASGVIDYTQISPAAASTVLSGNPEEIDELRETIVNAPVGSQTTESFNVGNSEFDTGGRFDVDTIFDSSAYDGLTEDQKIKLKEGINRPISSTWNQTFADGGYLEKYDDGGYANMSTYEKLKAIADSHYG